MTRKQRRFIRSDLAWAIRSHSHPLRRLKLRFRILASSGCLHTLSSCLCRSSKIRRRPLFCASIAISFGPLNGEIPGFMPMHCETCRRHLPVALRFCWTIKKGRRSLEGFMTWSARWRFAFARPIPKLHSTNDGPNGDCKRRSRFASCSWQVGRQRDFG